MPRIHDNVLTTIGRTPMVRLTHIGAELDATLLAKLEYYGPGGSVKDRIGVVIIDAAERDGRLRPGGTIVEATSGNTGVGLAIAAALRGYRCVFVMPDKMSDEKIRLLRAFGARVVLTPTAVAPDDPRSYYSVARRLAAETPNAILADQYYNPVNPQAHYETTGPEIWQQTGGRVTHMVAGLGTGGTISGVGRYLKEQNPDVLVIGVDPVGSILYDLYYNNQVPEPHVYKVEGIGEDFLPGTLDFGVIDDVVQVSDAESLQMTRELVRREGIFCGGSSGSAVVGALKYAKHRHLGRDCVAVIILPDSGSRYLSKVFDDDWMREHGLLEPAGLEGSVADILAWRGSRPLIGARVDDRVTDVVQVMKRHDISQLPVLRDGRELAGIITEVDLLKHMLEAGHEHTADETIEPIISSEVAVIHADTSLSVLGEVFSQGKVAIVVGEDHEPTAILTKIDLIDYLAQRLTKGGP
jgi:cystathionine beta-synthase